MGDIKKLNILLAAEFHHLGLAVPSIDKNLDKTYDPRQKVTVAFIDLNGVKVELVKPEGENSPAKNFIGKGIYHLCFQAKDLRQCLARAKKNGFKLIAPPVAAEAFSGRKIAWLISAKYGLIELLQK